MTNLEMCFKFIPDFLCKGPYQYAGCNKQHWPSSFNHNSSCGMMLKQQMCGWCGQCLAKGAQASILRSGAGPQREAERSKRLLEAKERQRELRQDEMRQMWTQTGCYILDSPQTTLGPKPLQKTLALHSSLHSTYFQTNLGPEHFPDFLTQWHTLSLLFLHFTIWHTLLTYVSHYPVITDYLQDPLPYPYDTFARRATHNTLPGDLINLTIATDISAHFRHPLGVRARYLSYILCHR